MANELKSAILCFIAILAFHPAPVPQRPHSHFHSILRLPSCPNLLSPISPTATLCHGVGKCGSADSDSYTAIFHATPATAASKGKTSCPKQAKSLKPKIFCHCLWWLKRGAGILGLDRRKGIGVVLAMRLPAAGPTPPPLPFDLRICHKWGLGPSAHLQGQGCKSEMEVVKGTALWRGNTHLLYIPFLC